MAPGPLGGGRIQKVGVLSALVVLAAFSMTFMPFVGLAMGAAILGVGLMYYLREDSWKNSTFRSSGLIGGLWTGFWFFVAANPGLALLARSNLYLWSAIGVFAAAAFLCSLLVLIVLGWHRLRELPPLTVVSLFLTCLIAALSLARTPMALGDRTVAVWGSYIGLVCQTAFIVGMFGAQRRTSELLRAMVMAFIGGATVTLALLIIHGGLGNARFGDAEVLHPNTVGALGGLGLIAALTLGAQLNPIMRAISLSVFPIVLLYSVSKTSLVATALAVGLWWLLSSPKEKLIRTFFILSAAFALWALAGEFLSESLSQYIANTDRVSTLSGRTELWKETLRLSGDSPILGFGFATFPDVIEARAQGLDWSVYRIAHAHNSYLTVLLEQGLVGLFLHVWLIIICICFILRLRQHVGSTLEGKFAVTLLCFLLVRSFSEGALALRGDFLYLVLLLAMLESRWRQRDWKCN